MSRRHYTGNEKWSIRLRKSDFSPRMPQPSTNPILSVCVLLESTTPEKVLHLYNKTLENDI